MSEQLPCLQHILLYNDAQFQNCKTLEKPGWFTLLINQGKIRIIKQASWIFMTCRWCASMCSSLKHPANDVQWRRIRGTFLPLFSFLQGILKKTKKASNIKSYHTIYYMESLLDAQVPQLTTVDTNVAQPNVDDMALPKKCRRQAYCQGTVFSALHFLHNDLGSKSLQLNLIVII